MGGFTSNEDQETFNRIEKQFKKRFQVGTYVSEHIIIDEFTRQNYDEALVKKVCEHGWMRGRESNTMLLL